MSTPPKSTPTHGVERVPVKSSAITTSEVNQNNQGKSLSVGVGMQTTSFNPLTEWTIDSLAEKLHVSKEHKEHPVIKEALGMLIGSPLLVPGSPFPALNKTKVRKREDYVCGYCHQPKKNHICSRKRQRDTLSIGGASPDEEVFRPNKRAKKKVYKPLQVLLLDNMNASIQNIFEYIHSTIGEKNVSITLTITPPLDGGSGYSVTALGSFGENSGLFLGSLSPMYKEHAKAAIEDGTITLVRLAPLKKYRENGKSSWVAQLLLYRSTSWKMKRLVEIEYLSSLSNNSNNTNNTNNADANRESSTATAATANTANSSGNSSNNNQQKSNQAPPSAPATQPPQPQEAQAHILPSAPQTQKRPQQPHTQQSPQQSTTSNSKAASSRNSGAGQHLHMHMHNQQRKQQQNSVSNQQMQLTAQHQQFLRQEQLRQQQLQLQQLQQILHNNSSAPSTPQYIEEQQRQQRLQDLLMKQQQFMQLHYQTQQMRQQQQQSNTMSSPSVAMSMNTTASASNTAPGSESSSTPYTLPPLSKATSVKSLHPVLSGLQKAGAARAKRDEELLREQALFLRELISPSESTTPSTPFASTPSQSIPVNGSATTKPVDPERASRSKSLPQPAQPAPTR